MQDVSLEQYRNQVDKWLIYRQRIFFGIIVVLLTICTWDVIQNKISPLLAITGFLLSVVLGIALSRIFKIFWHEEKAKVTYQLDTVGIILLVVYFIIEINRAAFFGKWLEGATLSSFSLIILTGLMTGRFVGTLFKVTKILNEGKE